MFKVCDKNGRAFCATTPEDVFREVERITKDMYCAARAREWAKTRNRFPRDKYSLTDFEIQMIRDAKSDIVDLGNREYFRVVALG